MARISLQGVYKRYGDVVAARDVNLTVEEAELVALLGPSGCGKTSTLKMIAGLETVSEGDILFDDRRMNDVPPEKRDVAMVFEDYSLYQRMTVLQNVMFPLKVRRVREVEARRHALELLELLELTDVMNTNVRELSGGQQQRVAIARALARVPAVLLLDEPLSHLDAQLRRNLRTEIRWLQMERGVTTILVTHDQSEALALADRIAVMHLGDVLQFGSPSDIYHHPTDMIVGGFIGSPPMSFLPCRVETRGRTAVVVFGEFEYSLDDEQSQAALRALGDGHGASDEYILGIRPEDLQLVEPGHKGALVGEVFFTEWSGEESTVMLSRPGTDDHWLTLVADGRHELAKEARVHFLIPTDRLHLFDAVTGRNLLVGEPAGLPSPEPLHTAHGSLGWIRSSGGGACSR